jgi:hypothetical protein
MLSLIFLALGTTLVHANGSASDVSTSESFMYTTPAMYLWVSCASPSPLRPEVNRSLTSFQLEVKQVEVLGNLSSGGTQLLGPITAGQLASEPGFEPQFNGSVKYAGDYLTQDPSDGVARPACVGAIYPDNGDSPFLFRIGGIDHASLKAVEIFTSDQDLNLSIPYGYSYSGWSSQCLITIASED